MQILRLQEAFRKAIYPLFYIALILQLPLISFWIESTKISSDHIPHYRSIAISISSYIYGIQKSLNIGVPEKKRIYDWQCDSYIARFIYLFPSPSESIKQFIIANDEISVRIYQIMYFFQFI